MSAWGARHLSCSVPCSCTLLRGTPSSWGPTGGRLAYSNTKVLELNPIGFKVYGAGPVHGNIDSTVRNGEAWGAGRKRPVPRERQWKVWLTKTLSWRRNPGPWIQQFSLCFRIPPSLPVNLHLYVGHKVHTFDDKEQRGYHSRISHALMLLEISSPLPVSFKITSWSDMTVDSIFIFCILKTNKQTNKITLIVFFPPQTLS